MPLETLDDALTHELSDLLSAEKQFAKLLQQVAKNADSPQVKQMAEEHRQQTLQHADNLMQAFEIIGEKPERMVCKAAQGLVEEATSTIKEEKPKGALKDVVLIGGSLRVEHYEIAAYTATIGIAKQLGQRQVVQILQTNLKDEQDTARKLTAAAPQFTAASETEEGNANGNGSNGNGSAASKTKSVGSRSAASKAKSSR